ncbi:MAG: orotidine-5'-phosphate decarboxylase [bacterium]|nr:MAG: orotidine-5'-phosphate decarboxylase [bacterium]
MFKEKLKKYTQNKNSLLCIGLDCDIRKIPPFLLEEDDPLFTFNREIIEATADLAIAFKPNIAFYETLGPTGWHLLEKTLEYIPGDCLVIADAKRGDIGNSARKYADLYFQSYSFDAITVSPYMGYDSIQPFIEYDDKATFVLCLTSNSGSHDFQYLNSGSEPLYLKIARKVSEWNLEKGNCGLVVGATHPENLSSIREVSPQLPLLIPGIGTQGGNLKLTVQYGTDEKGEGALINVSRSIIYASPDENFAEAARDKALEYKHAINAIRKVK